MRTGLLARFLAMLLGVLSFLSVSAEESAADTNSHTDAMSSEVATANSGMTGVQGLLPTEAEFGFTEVTLSGAMLCGNFAMQALLTEDRSNAQPSHGYWLASFALNPSSWVSILPEATRLTGVAFTGDAPFVLGWHEFGSASNTATPDTRASPSAG